MDNYQMFFLPLGAFWIYFNCMMTSAKVINEMRDTIAIGSKTIDGQNSESLSLAHKRVMSHDWKLMMWGTIGGSFLFAGILIGIGIHILQTVYQTAVAISLFAVSMAPLAGGILFSCCIKQDRRLINESLKQSG
ncbi:membrane hypothetical protein [Candidatus Magnetomoraceae bacterium gMMP-15]